MRRRKQHDETEDAPDPAAVEGERRSRELDPWGVVAFEVGLAFRRLEAVLETALGGLGHAQEG